MDFEYGVLQQLTPGIRRLVCNNPSPFTFKGTNSYVLGVGDVAVVDPGPASGEHLNELGQALSGEHITHILITHCHSDHSGAAVYLKERTGAQLCGMPRAANDPSINATGPSGHRSVTPVTYDRAMKHGDKVAGESWQVEAIHTPGHAPDHLSFYLPDQNVLLSGDHVMGWNTSVIAPPEGHMGSYLRSLDLLMARRETAYYPGHGGPILEPQRFVKALIFHRRWRENEISECLRGGMRTIDEIVPKIYAGLDPALSRAAALAVFAQLELMVEKGIVSIGKPGGLAIDQEFALSGRQS
jgi:glyoxylase-like metal-dependent hydrolase (beta-lactamase superfamily II)